MNRARLLAFAGALCFLIPTGLAAPDADLHHAAQAGNLTELRQLLSRAPERIQTVDAAGETALFAAVRARQPHAVELLLSYGADPRFKNKAGATPLHVDAADGNRSPEARQARRTIAELLLKAGAEVNAADAEGMTPLLVALARQREELLDLLTAAGADVTLKDQRGRAALHYAAQGNLPAMIDRLAEMKVDVNAADDTGNTALHMAAMRMRPVVIESLLSRGANVNAVNPQGESALHVLVSAPRRETTGEQPLIELAELLITAGADVNLRASDGKTVLGRVLDKDLPALARFLEGKGGVR